MGRVGDRYRVVDAKAAEQRGGSGNTVKLKDGDVLMRTAHSGDCFCDYAVFRDDKRLGKWWGYEGVGKYLNNVVDGDAEEALVALVDAVETYTGREFALGYKLAEDLLSLEDVKLTAAMWQALRALGRKVEGP